MEISASGNIDGGAGAGMDGLFAIGNIGCTGGAGGDATGVVGKRGIFASGKHCLYW